MSLSEFDGTEREVRLREILLAYVEAVENGESPDRRMLLSRHAEFAAELTEFFEAEEQVDGLAGPLRPLWPVPPAENGRNPETLPARALGGGLFPDALLGVFDEFDLLEEIGRGGMGVIYRARHRTLNRVVALKVIRGGQFASPAEVQRFRAEAESAAALDHPHIVPIYRVGEHRGQPYFTMKLIGGGSLADRLARGGTPAVETRGAARLMATVARAVHHAHQRGILHRDLKPANILLDDRGEPHVSDFGLAKRAAAAASLTETGLVVGTPAYMAPEQAAGRKQVLTTTDVYSLGVILYELIVGRRPFQGATPLSLLRQVMEREAERPRAVNPHLDADLETICLTCLHKEPERRYSSALALAEDLERWLAGEPIQARRSRAWERGVKWVRRQPALAAALISAALAVLGSIVLLGILWRNAEERATERADHNRQLHDVQEELGQRQGELNELEQTIEGRREEAAQLQESSRTATREMRRALYIRDIQLARLALDNEQNDTLLMLLERQRPQPGEEDFRGFAWRYLWGRCHRAKHVLRGHGDFVSRAVFAPDGKAVLAAGTEGALKMWDASTGEERPLPWKATEATLALVFSPDGRTLALGGRDGRLRLRDWPSGREQAVIPAHPKAVLSVAISPDGQTLVSGGEDGKVKFWDIKSRNIKSTIADHREAVTRTVFSPDGKSLATVSTDRSARLWAVADQRPLALFMDSSGAWIADAAFRPDGKEIAVVSMQPFSFMHQHSGSVQMAAIDGNSVKMSRTLPIAGGGAFAVAYAADGQTLLWGGNSGNVILWDRAAAQIRDILHGHTDRVHTLAFSPDGRTLASGGNDKTLRLWNLPPRMELSFTNARKQPCRAVALAPDGKRFAAAGANGAVSLRSTVTGREEASLGRQGGQVKALAFAPDGRTLAVGNDDGRVHIWDLQKRKERICFTGPRQWISSLAFSPDGRTLAAAAREANVYLWDMTFGWRRKVAVADVWTVAFAPDGGTLAVAGGKGLALCDPLTCQVRTILPGSEGAGCVAFSPDGKRLAAGAWHRTESLKMWDLPGGKGPIHLQGHAGPVVAVRFTPDGRTIISASHDATVKFWDAAARLELLTLRDHHDSVGVLELSADGQLLMSSSEDGSVRLWRAPREVAAR